jgi:hypothetical protein
MQQRAFERQENAERGWRQMYEGQLRVTQESDQAWAAKLRDAQDALVRMRAERNEARADAVACAVAYRDRRPINGGVLQRIDGYVGAMRVDRACAQERSLAEQMARVEYVETSLVTDPPDPLCAIDGSRVEEESMP